MIPRGYIIEWSEQSPWNDMYQIEQDLIISRVLVTIYNDDYLSKRLAFRGGTAIHRLYITPQVRYSEDIDLVQISPEPIGSTLDRLRFVLSFLGIPSTQRKASNNTLVYKMRSTFPPEIQMKLKIEINCKEHYTVLGYIQKPFEMQNAWFTGKSNLVTYDFNELLGTKLRALYQRRKGRDLFDLYMATFSPSLNTELVAKCFHYYMESSVGNVPTYKMFINNLDEKLKIPQFTQDMESIIMPGFEYNPVSAVEVVKETFLMKI